MTDTPRAQGAASLSDLKPKPLVDEELAEHKIWASAELWDYEAMDRLSPETFRRLLATIDKLQAQLARLQEPKALTEFLKAYNDLAPDDELLNPDDPLTMRAIWLGIKAAAKAAALAAQREEGA